MAIGVVSACTLPERMVLGIAAQRPHCRSIRTMWSFPCVDDHDGGLMPRDQQNIVTTGCAQLSVHRGSRTVDPSVWPDQRPLQRGQQPEFPAEAGMKRQRHGFEIFRRRPSLRLPWITAIYPADQH
jgi:hypothetical protein